MLIVWGSFKGSSYEKNAAGMRKATETNQPMQGKEETEKKFPGKPRIINQTLLKQASDNQIHNMKNEALEQQLKEEYV